MTNLAIREMLQTRNEKGKLAEAGGKLAKLLKQAADHHFKGGCRGCDFPLFEAELALLLWEQLQDEQAKVKVPMEGGWEGVRVDG